MKTIIKKFRDCSFEEWNRYLEYFDYSVNYTFWFINYLEVLNLRFKIINETYLILNYENKSEPLAIVPLYIETIDKHNQISTGNEPIFGPILSKYLQKKDSKIIKSIIFSQFENFFIEFGCKSLKVQFSPFLKINFLTDDFLKNNFKIGISFPDWYTNKCDQVFILNLNKTKEKLFKSIRKGHRANIKRTSQKSKIIILDQDNQSESLFKEYVDLYLEIKGNLRSMKAFENDYNAIKGGFEIIFMCLYENNIVGAIAVHKSKRFARYNSSFQRYQEDIFPNHFLIWNAICYLKDRGVEQFEVGEKINSNLGKKIAVKEQNLSHFKAGWGGDLAPWIKFEKLAQ